MRDLFSDVLDLALQLPIFLAQAVVSLVRVIHVEGELFDLRQQLHLHLAQLLISFSFSSSVSQYVSGGTISDLKPPS